MRGLLALILAVATPQQAPLPAADAPLPREPAQLAAAFTDTTRRLRATGWDGTGEIPRDVTYLALHHQRILRELATERRLGDRTLAQLPPDVKGEARDTVQARRHIAAIPRGPSTTIPKVRVAKAAPANELRAHYADAQRRFGIHWSILASINFVESAFGRVRSASESGAKGPMQFMPATWRAFGNGGDINDPHDAILAAARYLKASGAPADYDRALYAYNHSTSYVRAIRRYAARMRADERTFRTYYAWQVYVLTSSGGTRRMTGPGR
ncbi:transglycosylase SLT domain-containing protein [Solirubrobacter sp. CPCC 204708]|uniref:Transglycosylase SLT domain-containing protein n=1 Tax=Solirubrobacter deserti TaxID=2282478 RepID=A0ABT4RDZ3_9ACTN|nr:transglycosylase SLT domain-containing protein [Solirubrobacter deserti]MBE2316007.1 transglycosylase SLT domain-containing protein [Solirubrobacter deserti]MDA0136759.1 transglycosylase SLT domain-containing protein [Solirubrobacter deserti]